MFNNQSQSAKTNESTIDIKHASACAQEFSLFLFLLFLYFEQVVVKISREYICQDFDAK
jgi:hypothetical protein